MLRVLLLCSEINLPNLSQECRAVREGFVARLIILEATLVRDIQAMEEWWWMGGARPHLLEGVFELSIPGGTEVPHSGGLAPSAGGRRAVSSGPVS